jgi:hypothetical protein
VSHHITFARKVQITARMEVMKPLETLVNHAAVPSEGCFWLDKSSLGTSIPGVVHFVFRNVWFDTYYRPSKMQQMMR